MKNDEPKEKAEVNSEIVKEVVQKNTLLKQEIDKMVALQRQCAQKLKEATEVSAKFTALLSKHADTLKNEDIFFDLPATEAFLLGDVGRYLNEVDHKKSVHDLNERTTTDTNKTPFFVQEQLTIVDEINQKLNQYMEQLEEQIANIEGLAVYIKNIVNQKSDT